MSKKTWIDCGRKFIELKNDFPDFVYNWEVFERAFIYQQDQNNLTLK